MTIKFIKIKTLLAEHDICISRSTKKDYWYLFIIAWGECYSKQYKTLKQCFKFIRHIFGKEKQNGKNKIKSNS